MTNTEMVRAFNEWMRRYINNPAQFEREFQTVERHLRETAAGDEPSYGAVCAAYMERLAGEARP